MYQQHVPAACISSAYKKLTFNIVDITVKMTELNIDMVAATVGHSFALSLLLWFQVEPRHWCASSLINKS